uniref:deSI-like protein At4g17486 n=1 Tax=Erigeron canadensis TaxID=72917 RepID=UPI001CB89400|nr:deSI-like protein At4g17486 [Erigeron canadensis]
MLRRGRNSPRCRKAGSVPVYLNVYDITSMNGCTYWLGLGAYHSGVQVHGVEFAFGSHDHATTGIFEGKPKQFEGFVFRKQIMIGWTDMNLREVRRFMEQFAENYKGISYNMITRNCNHFCNEACLRLTGNPIPSWVNRLARIGLLCNCIIPTSISSCKVGIEDNVCNEEEKAELWKRSSRFTSSSSSTSSSERSTVASTTIDLRRSFGTRSFVPPSSPFLLDCSYSSS